MKKQRVVRGLAEILSRRKRKKRGLWKGRRGIVFRAVVFLSVPLFKGTLALITLTYSALGVIAGAQLIAHSTCRTEATGSVASDDQNEA